MFLLIFFVLFLELVTYWIFDPITSFLTNILKIKFLPFLALLAFIYLFSKKDDK